MMSSVTAPHPRVSEPMRIACVTNTSFSGSTIFSLLADAHPRVVALGDGLNPKILRARGSGFLCSCGKKLTDCEFWVDVFARTSELGAPLTLEDANLRYSFLHPLWDRLIGRYFDDPIRGPLRWMAERYWPRYRRHVQLHNARNVAFSRAVLDVSKKDVYIHNTKPLLMLYHLRDVPELDIKVINMVRDARGYVHSSMKRGSTAKDAAIGWRRYHNRVRDITSGMDADRILTLKYEELCGNTQEAMRAVFDFLGVDEAPVSSTVVPEDHHIAGNDLRLKKELNIRLDDSWAENLSANDLTAIEAICRPTSERLGYSW